jgi:sugar phosphate isomerase/epimerase
MTSDGVAAVTLSNGSQPVGTFQERVLALRRAGFTKMGLSFWVYRELKRIGTTPATMRALLDDNGVRVVELEVALGIDADSEGPRRWGPEWLDIDVPYVDDEVEAELFEMADVFGPHHLVVVGSWRGELNPDRCVERFARWCDRAATHDVAVALEFVPGTSIPDLGTALEIVVRADRDNGGLCFDTWHYRLGESDPELIDQIPVDKITVLQLADGPASLLGPVPTADDYFRLTMSARLLPGLGDFDLPGVLRRLSSRGIEPEMSVEILSTTLRDVSVDEGATAIATATRDLLRAAAEVTDQ